MSCKDCIHFYEREPKPWRTMADIGYCDHSREGKIEINMYCPVNKCCDNKYEPIPVMVYPQVDGITPTVVADEGVCNRGSHIINEQYTESMLR